jgi:flavodoxin
MKTLIIYKSIHHKNTEKVAKVMAEALGANLAQPEEIDPSSLAGYDLIGFGSGIYFGKHHKALLNLARTLPPQDKTLAFVYSSCGGWRKNYHKALLDALLQKGFTIKGEFTCNGFDTFGPFKLIGGLKKGHPDEKDLENARMFAKSLMDQQ